MHQSFATIDSPEFINLQPLDINPLMSSCEIKVLYLGENRNHTFISKEVAAEMAKTLRGAPIVGYYKEEKQDFADHGERIIIDDEGIRFECMTVPYGFVAPDAKVWFQKFEDKDEFGNSVVREYLMTTGFLWTGQFEECQSILEGEGKPHSMELDNETLEGHWAENSKTHMEFFIINDAIFSKLCVLGEDVEPCFEGSSIKAPEVSLSFTKVDDDFKKTLYTMMQDLRSVLEGGQTMTNLENQEVPSVVEENVNVEDNFSLETSTENQVNTEVETSTVSEEGAAAATDFAKENDEDKQNDENKDESENKNNEESEDGKKEDEEDEDKYALLQKQYDELQAKFTAIEEECQALRSYKADKEDKEKDTLINRFYMLDEEDKKDIVSNKANYTLEEIESKLSVIYTKKQLAMEKVQESTSNEDNNIYTYSLPDTTAANVPDWVKAVCKVQEEL